MKCVCALTARHQFDLPADGSHFIPGQAADGQCVFQVTKHDLALQVIILVHVGVHCDLCGVGGEGGPGGRVICTTGWE